MSKRLKIQIWGLIGDWLILLLVVFALLMGFYDVWEGGDLSAAHADNLKYFTWESNLLLGFSCFCFIPVRFVSLLKGRPVQAKWAVMLEFLGATSTTLTLFVVCFFFAPVYQGLHLFSGTNLFFHLLVPLLGIIHFSFCGIEGEIRFRDTFWGILPMLLYSIFYCAEAYTHIAPETGIPFTEYDWYWFAHYGVAQAAINFLFILVASWGISLLLWWFHKLARHAAIGYDADEGKRVFKRKEALNVFHVSRHAKAWQVQLSQSKDIIASFPKFEDALSFAKNIAEASQGEVRVHKLFFPAK